MGAGLPYYASRHTETGLTRVELAAVWRGVKRGEDRAGGFSKPFFPFTIHDFAICSYPRFPRLGHNPPQSLPSGTPIMTVVWWGGTGASGGGLT
jgi:hypothetical protein